MSRASDYLNKKKVDFNWFQDVQSEQEAYSYLDELTLTDKEIHKISNKYEKNYLRHLNEFKEKTSLTDLDISILLATACLQTLRWALIDNNFGRFDKAAEADKVMTPKPIEQMFSTQVPYDAIRRTDEFKAQNVDISTGLSGITHRYLTLGHDPLAGWIFGTMNILTDTLTKNDLPLFTSYRVENQSIMEQTNIITIVKESIDVIQQTPEALPIAFLKQALHYNTDVFTKMGLPIPILNTISPETSKALMGKDARIDFYSITRGATLSILINKLVEYFHRLYCDPAEDRQLYDVRTRKILMYSNTLSSVINVGYVMGTSNFTKLDVGGILITLWRIFNDEKIINKIKADFINKCLSNDLQKEEDEINEKLAKYGFSI
jgi:hypothetical protein